jgi:hypothetical protein
MASGSAGLDGEQGSRRGLALSTVFDIGRGISAMNPAATDPRASLAAMRNAARLLQRAASRNLVSSTSASPGITSLSEEEKRRGGAFCDGADVIPSQ